MNNFTELVEIVVARYNENLNWTTIYPFNQFKYIVYNKGNNDNFTKDNVKKIINLENVGRECHTYLHHILQNYDNNGLAPITVFTVGSISLPNETDNPYKYKKMYTLCKYLLDNKCNHAIIHAESCNLSVQKKFYNFAIDEWNSTSKENNLLNNNNKLIRSQIRPFQNWYNFHFGNLDVKWWSYNSIFSLDKHDILSGNKEKYTKIYLNLQRGENLEEVHFVERAWIALFSPLTHTLIQNMNQTTCAVVDDGFSC